ncbi:hypothetical protein SNK03_13643 [Fusarium graminearum]
MDHCNDSAGHGHSGFTLSSQQRVKLGLMKVREQTESIMTQELDPQVINTLRIVRVIQVLYTTVFLMGLEYITVLKGSLLISISYIKQLRGKPCWGPMQVWHDVDSNHGMSFTRYCWFQHPFLHILQPRI